MLFPVRGQALRKKQASRCQRNQRKLNLELLEDRLLLRSSVSVFYVTNTSDGGTGSLRQAIASVNLDPLSNGQDIIEPNPANIGTIFPLSALPALTRSDVTIQGLNIDGSQAGSGADGLDIEGSGITIVGLGITGFGGTGVSVTGDQVLVNGSTIMDNGGSRPGCCRRQVGH
jgi:hypothetical protein